MFIYNDTHILVYHVCVCVDLAILKCWRRVQSMSQLAHLNWSKGDSASSPGWFYAVHGEALIWMASPCVKLMDLGMCGKSSLKKLRTEGGWGSMPPASIEPLEQALTVLEEDLKSKKEEKKDMHRASVASWGKLWEHCGLLWPSIDIHWIIIEISLNREKLEKNRQLWSQKIGDDVADWEPKDRNSLALRMHYLARAKPIEDERTIKAQHVAPGTWYYKVPVNAENKDWLKLRSNAKEMVYGMEDDDAFMNNVPLRTSRGKAGGLNFSENYLCLYADRPENMYNDERDNYPCLYSICDARHQFQTDFFHTTIPYFFDDDMELNPYVGFTQCPQFFHEMQDKLDYLDNNNAQFFRLNCMIRNCCGGVSSCGTNGTWMIRHPPGDLVWEKERRRVRDVESKRKSQEYVERRTFHESCKVEDTASSLQQVLRGRRSQFINRRLSFGMAKNPVDYLAAVQRWAEGGVVLSLQTFFSCHKGRECWRKTPTVQRIFLVMFSEDRHMRRIASQFSRPLRSEHFMWTYLNQFLQLVVRV